MIRHGGTHERIQLNHTLTHIILKGRLMRRTRYFMSAVFAVLFLSAGMSAAAVTLRVPAVIHDDFETGEMHAWESYPYAQDIGYEPFTVTRREPAHNGSAFSLAKTHRANDIVEVYEGFTKEIDLWTVDDTSMKVALFCVADRDPEYIELSIGLFDGRRYFHTVRTPEANRWMELEIPLHRFTMGEQALSAGEHVQAVTIMAFYPQVSHILSYTICMDDFILNGERQRRFVALEPPSTTFEMYGYSVLNRHYYYGDSMDISVRPESMPDGLPLSSVTCSLVDPSGKTVASGKKLSFGNGAWSADDVHTFGEDDARGQWTVDFMGLDGEGNETVWGFRFIMPGRNPASYGHPRTLFTAEEFRRKMETQSPREAEMVDDFLRNPEYFQDLDLSGITENHDLSSEALTGHQFSKIRFGSGWSGPIRTLSSIAEAGALRYAFTGDETAGRKACEALVKLCSFERWNHPWQLARGNHTYYPVGYTTGQAGIAFDLAYPLMTHEERRIAREGIMDKGIMPFYRDMVEMNRMPSSVTNHIAVIVANCAIAGTAIYGEDPDNPCLEPWFSGVLAKMKRFIDRTYYPDGSYGEPMGYENMATRDIVESLHVLERMFGIDYTTTTNIKEIWRYPIHGAFSDGTVPDFGDVHLGARWGWSGNPFLWLTYRMQNPWTAHYVQPALQTGRAHLFDWLWYTTGLETKSREQLIPSHHFPVKGTMFLRTGWEDEGSIMVFKSGPNSNHYHLDQGSIILMTNGELLLSEAGLESVRGFHAYYSNPYFPAYDTQAMGHNVMVIDGDPESQMPAHYRNGIESLSTWPEIRHSFAGWHVDEVEGDLACVYKGKVSEYTRSILFVKPDIYVLYDRVRSPEEHAYSWIFHAEDVDGERTVSMEDERISIVRPKARLDMDVLAPELESSRIRAAIHHEHLVQLNGFDGVKTSEFVAVMVPKALDEGSTAGPSFTSTLIEEPDWTGALVEKEGEVTRICFRTGVPGMSEVDGFATDAERFAVTAGGGGRVSRLFVREGTAFTDGTVTFASTAPVSASVVYAAGETALEVDADREAEITIDVPGEPSSVTVDGASARGWRHDGDTGKLRITLPAGHAVVAIRY